MMKGASIIRSLAVPLLFALLASCTAETEGVQALEPGVPMTLNASFAESRSSKTEISADGVQILWSPGDRISVFYGSGSSGTFTSTNTDPAAVAIFQGSLDVYAGGAEESGSKFRAVYPWREDNSCDAQSLTLTLPAVQEAADGSFSGGLFPAVAMGDTPELAFYNVCGGLRFTLEEEAVDKVIIRSNDETPLAGRIRVAFGDDGRPFIVSVSDASDSLVVNAPSGGFVPGVQYFAVMLPGSHPMGLNTAFCVGDKRISSDIGKSVTVKRSTFGIIDGIDECIAGSPLFLRTYKVPEAGDTGAALYLRGDNLYCGTSGKIQVYDISDPMKPRLRSSCTIAAGARQIVADERGIYVSTRGRGVFILDASDLDNIRFLKRYDTIELATGIDVAGDVLFVTLRGYGVEFVDISNLSDPRHIYCHQTAESQSCWYQDGYLYSGEWGKGLVTTIDASDMSAVSECSVTDLYGCGDGLSTLGNRLYVATGHHARHSDLTGSAATGAGHGVDIFDISVPSAPRFISRAQFDLFYQGGNGDWWTVRPSADGKTIFAADTFNGLYSVDLSDEQHPRVADRLVLPDTFVSSVAVGDGVVYVTGQQYGLLAVRCPAARKVERGLGRLPAHPEARYPYATPQDSHFTAWMPDVRGQVRALAVAGDYLVAACSDAGLYVLEKDGDGGLRAVSRGTMPFAGDVSVRDGRIWVAEGLDGLGVYSLDGNGSLNELARITDFGYDSFKICIWVNAISSRYVIVNDRGGVGYLLLDTENFPAVRAVLRHNLGSPWYDKYIACEPTPNGYLPCPVMNSGMSWIYLGDGNPRSTPRNSKGQAMVNKDVVPSSGACPFRDGTFLMLVGSNLTQYSAGPFTEIARVKGNFKGAMAWDGENSLAIEFRQQREFKKADIATVPGARILWREILEGYPDRAVFWDGRIYAPGGYQGILIEKL